MSEQLRDDVRDVLNELAGMADLICREDVDNALDEIMTLVREYYSNVTIARLPLPAGYETQPHGVSYTHPMRINL